MTIKEIKANEHTSYGVLVGHRSVHGCRGRACEEAKRLRAIWATWSMRLDRAEGPTTECAYDGTRKQLADGRCVACGRDRATARRDAAK